MKLIKFFKPYIFVLFFTFVFSYMLISFETVYADNTETKVSTYLPTSVPQPAAHMDYGINIIVKPDLISSNPNILKGFVVSCNGSSTTNESGRCDFRVYPGSSYNVSISKGNYLRRTIVAYPAAVPGSTYVVDIWPGDVNQDNIINMVDLIEISKSFDCLKGDSMYDINYDFNMDDVINMADVLIVAKHFNSTPESYIN
ncbi:MAG TPA: dockerin type I domain-containing protein [Pseudobacteroides sp.]|uniref:dockerin type I domain-containing protein n=1 Tax=Pseudobacteroides sp. TaxID=1968840 RepID=UPI002F95B245